MGQHRSKQLISFVYALTLLAPFEARADEPVDLLTLPQARLETSSLIGEPLTKATAWTDGHRDTTASVVATGETIDLVFAFGGQTVAPEAISVTLSNDAGAERPARIEVLASTVSPQSGFQSLRSDPIEAGKSQRFTFNPTAARWVMLRITPSKPGQPVALGEIEVLGHLGAPATVYAFGESPAKIIDILSRLETDKLVSASITSDESQAFQKARGNRLDGVALADVALLASGVQDPLKRKAYLARLAALETKAHAAVASAHSPAEMGDLLLRFLHKEVLAKGYVSNQTDLAVLLDDHTFNCVSSAVIYNILALQLGLDVRAIEVPDHAFSIVYQGVQHMDVETTNALGFNPSRDPKRIESFEKLTGFRYIPDSHRDQRREVTEAGLAAIIYYNKGVELDLAKRHHDALLAYFRAMSLDPEFASAARNALATLTNWSVDLVAQAKWKEALDVARIGASLAPGDAGLAQNHKAIWQGWANSLADAGRRDEAVAILKQAHAALPAVDFEAMEAWVYIKPGEELAKTRNWKAAYTATEPGLAKLDPAALKELVRWRDALFMRWAQAEIDDGHFNAAADVLANRLAQAPTDGQIPDRVAYLGQEWAKSAGTADYARGLDVFTNLDRRFPGIAGLNDVARSYIWHHVSGLAAVGKLDEGLAAISAASPILQTAEEQQKLGAYIFDTIAKDRMKTHAWCEAADIYARGLGQYPRSDLLKGNVAYLAQEWQKAAFDKGGTSEVAIVTAALAVKFPQVASLGEAGRNQLRHAVGLAVDAGDDDKALALVREGSSLLNANDTTTLYGMIYDRRARKLMAAKDWLKASDAYAEGLALAGQSDLLRNNAVYLAQEWSRDAYASGGVNAVLPVARKIAERFPGLPDAGEGAVNVINAAVNHKVRGNEFQAAIAIVEQAGDLLPRARSTQLYEYSFDHWARSFFDKKQWQEAVKIYDLGLKRVPDSGLFKQNREYALAQPG